MTCRELYAINNPDMGDPVDNGDCPDDYGYVPGNCHFCDPGRPMKEWDCDGCWNQEISEESKTINNLVDEACAFNPEIDRHALVEAIETLREVFAKDRDKPIVIGGYRFTKRTNGEISMSYVGAGDEILDDTITYGAEDLKAILRDPPDGDFGLDPYKTIFDSLDNRANVEEVAERFGEANSGYTLSPQELRDALALAEGKKELEEAMEKVAEIVRDPAPSEENDTPRILDSGNRREFESGAVRDIQEGKGRCDLLPLDVVALYIEGDPDRTDFVLWHIYLFQKYGLEHYLFGALAEFANKKREWCNQFTMFLELAKHFEEGAKKYGDNNWQKGIPVRCYIDSAVRHYLKFLRGDKDEPHDRAFCWNILCAIWTCKHKPELNDYRKEE